MGTTARIDGDLVVISVTGDLDLGEVAQFRSTVHRHIADGFSQLVIDLTECPFIDSAGLGVLVGARRRSREAGGSAELVVTTPHLARLITITELDRIFELHDSIERAAEAATAGHGAR
ncbi:MAG: STAS domain-containing protein [Acidimicrobiales bacterium]